MTKSSQRRKNMYGEWDGRRYQIKKVQNDGNSFYRVISIVYSNSQHVYVQQKNWLGLKITRNPEYCDENQFFYKKPIRTFWH